MAIFRKGVKIGKHDVRVGLGKKRAQGILRKLGVIDDGKGLGAHSRKANGEFNAVRAVVAKGEGFQMPVNFKVTFRAPVGISQETLGDGGYGGNNGGNVQSGGLDWQTHIMQNSTKDLMRERFRNAQVIGESLWKRTKAQETAMAEGPPGRGGPVGTKRALRKMELYCSKVSVPEKTINVTYQRQYGSPFPWPGQVQYGTLTTTFYCDGAFHIKNYFDAWQKLIMNDLTGNLNYYDEYTSEFDIFARTTLADKVKEVQEDKGLGAGVDSFAGMINKGIQKVRDVSSAINSATGFDTARDGKQAKVTPATAFRETYGCRVFQCFPQTVGTIDFDHSATDSIATFDVTWAYKQWNTFKMGNVGNRSTINLAIGEFRNEKGGLPFISDLPEELSGPLGNAVNQGITTGPLSKASNMLG